MPASSTATTVHGPSSWSSTFEHTTNRRRCGGAPPLASAPLLFQVVGTRWGLIPVPPIARPELRLRLLQPFLGPLALGDVVVGLERSRRSPLVVPLQGPAACRDDLGPIPSRVNEFALPAPRANQLSRDVFQRCGEDRLVQLVRIPPDGLVPRPPIQFLRAPVPVGDHIVHIAHEDRVVRQIEQRRLLS